MKDGRPFAIRFAARILCQLCALGAPIVAFPNASFAQVQANDAEEAQDYGDIAIKGFPDPLIPTGRRPGENADTTRTIETQRSPSHSESDGSFGLSGGWGGRRGQLMEDGFSFSGDYLGQLANLAKGGDRHATTYVGLAIAGVTADLDRLIGDQGGSLQITLTHLHGRNLESRTGLVTTGPVQGNWGRGTVGRLTALVYSKKIGDDFSFTIGRMPFISFDTFSCAFMNVAFCATSVGHNQYQYAYNPPISQWAAWTRIGSTRNAYLQFGAYVIEPKNLSADDAFEFGNFTGSSGVLLPVEVGLFPEIGKEGLPGSYKIGGWVETSTTTDIVLDTDLRPFAVSGGIPRRTKGRHGAYLIAVQQIARFGDRDENRGATVFVNAMQSDRRTSLLQREIAAGTFVKGLFRARPNDMIGIGFASTRINPRLAAVQALVGAEVQGAERVLEFYYGAQIHRGIVLQPGVQFLHNPGGLRRQGDPIVLGLKTALSF